MEGSQIYAFFGEITKRKLLTKALLTPLQNVIRKILNT